MRAVVLKAGTRRAGIFVRITRHRTVKGTRVKQFVRSLVASLAVVACATPCLADGEIVTVVLPKKIDRSARPLTVERGTLVYVDHERSYAAVYSIDKHTKRARREDLSSDRYLTGGMAIVYPARKARFARTKIQTLSLFGLNDDLPASYAEREPALIVP